MKLKNKIELIVVIIIICCFSSCQTTKNVSDKKTKQSSEKKLNYKMININEDSEMLSVNISYPEFDDLPQLNSFVKNTVINQYTSFKNYTKKEWNELKQERIKSGEKDIPPFGYTVKSLVTGTKKYQSVLIETYNYTGGAHGNTTLITFTLDKEKNKLVNIIEATGLTYKQLSQACNSELLNRFKKIDKSISEKEILEWINEGTFPTPDNYEIFTMDINGVTVYFETYSVAPYAYGQQEVFIPLSK